MKIDTILDELIGNKEFDETSENVLGLSKELIEGISSSAKVMDDKYGKFPYETLIKMLLVSVMAKPGANDLERRNAKSVENDLALIAIPEVMNFVSKIAVNCFLFGIHFGKTRIE